MKACLGLAVASFVVMVAHAGLRPGDVAVVAYNTDAPDDFAWVTFRPLPAGVRLNFTDASVSNGWFRMSEHLTAIPVPGPLTWSHTNAVPAGTVIRYHGAWEPGTQQGADMDLSTSGDQIFIYTGYIATNNDLPAPWLGDPAPACLLFGINFANGGWDNVTGGGTTTSFIPPGLCTGDCTAVHIDAHDNGYYSGPTTGTVEELRRAIADPANWTTSNAAFGEALWPAALFVLPPPPKAVLVIR